MSPTPTPESLLRDPDFVRLKNYIITVTGLSYYQHKDEDLAGRIGRRMAATSWTDCAGYLTRIGSSSAQGSELDLLVAELTIGETYFFRHTEQFDALRNLIIPELIKKNESTKTLRIWCAGCSTGAEPYSISILLRREFKLQLQGWTIDILGTDINRAFLSRATLGNFDEWHLRSVAAEIKTSCFTRSDKTYQLNPEFQKGVSFVHHNLITGHYPPRLESNLNFDIILCRNVMIYFSHETIATILPQFDKCLGSKGWMLLGYSEINTDLYKAFDLVPFPGAIIFRKKLKADALLAALPSQGSIFDFVPSGAQKLEAPPFSLKAMDVSPFASAIPVPAPIPTPVPAALLVPIHSLQLEVLQPCRQLADAGELKAALRIIDDLLTRLELEPRAHFLRATILVAMKNETSAEEAFRKAIYLDRKFVLAHYQLALLYRAMGSGDKAQKYLTNTRNLLEGMTRDTPLVEGKGMTSDQLLHLLRLMGDAA